MKGDPELWDMSGMASFETALFNLANHGRETVLAQAIQRKAHNVVMEADHLLALHRQALQMPLTELEQRIEVFEGYAEAARRNRQEIKDRLVGDKKRLRAFLEETIEKLRRRVQPELEQLALDAGLPTRDSHQNEKFQQAAGVVFDREQEGAHSQVIREINSILEARAKEALAIRERLRQEASDLLAISHSPLLTEDSQVDLSEPAWALRQLSVNLKPGFMEGLLPSSMRARREAERRHRLVRELTVRNAEKIRWWLLQVVQETLTGFEHRIEREMEETIQQIGRALQTGRERHRLGIDELEASLAGLEKSQVELRSLAEALAQEQTDSTEWVGTV
jgi:hypothetical protein